MITQNSCAQKEHQYTNKLIDETSPYLLQHAHNPVHWYPYGKEAFEKAKKEDKLILFSIGYAACHWCHVMEHESFENEAVAKIMNDNFVCVKVDKEERPDVDQIYMNAVQLLTGSGGWPLNCFALPDGRPVWGGTYFPPKDWSNILQNLASTYRKDKERFVRSAQELTRGVSQTELIAIKSSDTVFSEQDIAQTIENLKQRFDHQNGGFIGQPKFPMPGIYEMLMDYALVKNDTALLNHISFTLKKWAYGGIYDQIGGGFSRYSVDSKWLVPHFEKMLYDNGQILGLYAKMYRVTKEPVFKRIIEETADWIERDLTDKNGLFYSSYDADSEGKEGTFYLWKKSEIDSILKEQSPLFCDYYGLSEAGNFEASNILNVESMQEPSSKVEALKKQIFKVREAREKPSLDYKTLAAWNGLAISGLCEAYQATAEVKFKEMAIRSAETIQKKYIDSDGNLLRLHKKNRSVKAFLDDYALLIKAFLDLYTITFDDKWLALSEQLTNKANTLFLDKVSGMYFYTSSDENIVVRKMEISDNVIPSSNAVMAENLLRLSVLIETRNYEEMARQMAQNTKQQSLKQATYSYQWIHLMLQFLEPKKELVIVGEKANEKRDAFTKAYYPFLIVAGSSEENNNRPLLSNRFVQNKTLFYYCINNACQMPVSTVAEVKFLLN